MPRFAKTTASAATRPTCAYEEERLANIARNRERMAALGVLDAARDIARAAHAERLAEREKRAALTSSTTASGRQIAAARSAARPRVATRRSGRLSGSAPNDASARLETGDGLDSRFGAFRAETYTAAHRAALGTATTPWTLFVDGYDESGNRIYDKGPKGKTCHQCRQKTVCKHTSCSSCGAPNGEIRTDDIAPYFTIMVVGHVVVPPLLVVEQLYSPPSWVHMVVWPPLALLAAMLSLPRIKGAVMGWMWWLGIRGDEQH